MQCRLPPFPRLISLPDHRVKCYTSIGATIFGTKIPEVRIARMRNSLDSKRDAAIFIRSQSPRIFSQRLGHEEQEARIDYGPRSTAICSLGTCKLAGVRNWPSSSNSEVPGIDKVRRRDKPRTKDHKRCPPLRVAAFQYTRSKNGVSVKREKSWEEPALAGAVCRGFFCGALVSFVEHAL